MTLDAASIARLINAEARARAAAALHGRHLLVIGDRAYVVPHLRLGRKTVDRVAPGDVDQMAIRWPWVRCNCAGCWPSFNEDVRIADNKIVLTADVRNHLRPELRSLTARAIRAGGWL